MLSFGRSITRIFSGGAKAFTRYPMAMTGALVVAILASIRIQLDTPVDTRLFNSLQWAFAFVAIFSLAIITAAQSRSGKPLTFWLANGLGLAAGGTAFAALYWPAGVFTDIRISRIVAAIAISLLAFILLAAWPRERSTFNDSFFMTHKSLLIALLYGLVIMLGLFAVAFAVQSLLYKDLSEKVYQHIGTWSALLTFAFFLGYFPDFQRDSTDEHREVAQKQPRFIEILFAYVMIPIVLALTVVLLLWTIQIVITGDWPQFQQLAAIMAGYSLAGVWLFIMVSQKDLPLTRFYRHVYPIAALVFLGFAAWAFVRRLQVNGLKLDEYIFLLLWIFGVLAAVLLLVRPVRGNHWLAWLAMVLILVAVLPVIGYRDLPYQAQVSRLQQLLKANGLLVNGAIVPSGSVDKQAQVQITDAVMFITGETDLQPPAWLPANLSAQDTFRQTFGFDQNWAIEPGGNEYLSSVVVRPSAGIDLSGYQWAVGLRDEWSNTPTEVAGQKGTYQVTWQISGSANIPRLIVKRAGQTLIDETLTAYLQNLQAKYPLGSNYNQITATSADDLSFFVEADEIRVKAVLAMVEMNRQGGAALYYNVRLQAIFLGEKP